MTIVPCQIRAQRGLGVAVVRDRLPRRRHPGGLVGWSVLQPDLALERRPRPQVTRVDFGGIWPWRGEPLAKKMPR